MPVPDGVPGVPGMEHTLQVSVVDDRPDYKTNTVRTTRMKYVWRDLSICALM